MPAKTRKRVGLISFILNYLIELQTLLYQTPVTFLVNNCTYSLQQHGLVANDHRCMERKIKSAKG